MTLLDTWRTVATPVVGMLHCPPLPGSPRYVATLGRPPLADIVDFVLRDVAALTGDESTGDGTEHGVDGLMLENFGDAPFLPDRVGPETIAALTVVAAEVRRASALPLGINVLRNDGRGALAVAAAVGADFIRVNVLCGARLTDQGIVSGIAHDLLRDRARLGATSIKILADVRVKHSAALADSSLEDDVHDLIERGGADGLIVTGAATGKLVDPDELRAVKKAAGGTPVFVGSGVDESTVSKIVPPADGLIVGTSLKRDGRTTNPIDPDRVRRLMAAVRRL